MKPEYQARAEAAIKEEIELLRKQGATDANMDEPAFKQLVCHRVAVRFTEQYSDDDEFTKAKITELLEKAAPERLRDLAVTIDPVDQLAFCPEPFAYVKSSDF